MGEKTALKVDVCSWIGAERYISDGGIGGDGECSLFTAISFVFLSLFVLFVYMLILGLVLLEA